jgi:hypothetical protein
VHFDEDFPQSCIRSLALLNLSDDQIYDFVDWIELLKMIICKK